MSTHWIIPVLGTMLLGAITCAPGSAAGDVAEADRKSMEKPNTVVCAKDAGVISTAGSPHVKVVPVPVRNVKMGNGFWSRWTDANRRQGIPALLQQLEEHGVVDNFRIMTGRKAGARKGPYFTDSDLFKWMEGAAWALASGEDAPLHRSLNAVIDDVVAAQAPDGYLNTFFTGELAGQRFRNLAHEHELYCAGHLIQAAIADYRATGETKLLDAAVKYANYMVRTFGPGKKEDVDGHPEIEMALIELYRTTGNRDYLNLAGFFLGKQNFGKRTQIEGHAVRACYLCCGGADYYAETGDADSREALDRIWDDLTAGKFYITGGVGVERTAEAFASRYDLPNETSYAETCAAISNAMWSYRMLGITGDARYADMMERVLYNGFLSGVSLNTTQWFYVNPLACWQDYQRKPWFDCTCCPTNVVRTLASLPGYFYGVSKKGVWVHLYDASEAQCHIPDGPEVTLAQQTQYPWDGSVKIRVTPREKAEFSLMLRIPGWCRDASVKVNGAKVRTARPGSYLEICREWSAGDVVELSLPMPPEEMVSDPRVSDDLGRAAIQRGPVIYCAESVDNPGVDLKSMCLPSKPRFEARYDASLLSGISVLEGDAAVLPADGGQPVYRPAGAFSGVGAHTRLTLIPYYAWANRGNSRMTVWLPVLP